MPEYPIRKGMLKESGEEIRLNDHYQSKNRFVALFLICCAVFIAGFAVTALWGDGGASWLNRSPVDATPPTQESDGEETSEEFSESSSDEGSNVPSLPAEAIPVISLDLSCSERETSYINNESIRSPNISALSKRDVSSTVTDQPLVLVLHTHTSESYLRSETEYLLGSLGTLTYSAEEERNVIGVGSVLCETLNGEGIPTVHCKVIHDGDEKIGAYSKAEESIRFFLLHYPSIRYVIDLHRDSILTSSGEYVRAVTEIGGESVAQIMSVVGSDGGGMACENWEDNLALALQLRSRLNADGAVVCRPVTLRNATYNQELAPYSLLLEIGTGANTAEEAKRAAAYLGRCLAQLIKK